MTACYTATIWTAGVQFTRLLAALVDAGLIVAAVFVISAAKLADRVDAHLVLATLKIVVARQGTRVVDTFLAVEAVARLGAQRFAVALMAYSTLALIVAYTSLLFSCATVLRVGIDGDKSTWT
jgi:hypothetical protein